MELSELPRNEKTILRIVLIFYLLVTVGTVLALVVLLDQCQVTGLLIFICGMLFFIIFVGIKLTWKLTGRGTARQTINTTHNGQCSENPSGIQNVTIRQEEVVLSPTFLHCDVDPPNYQSVCQKQAVVIEEESPPTYYEALSLT